MSTRSASTFVIRSPGSASAASSASGVRCVVVIGAEARTSFNETLVRELCVDDWAVVSFATFLLVATVEPARDVTDVVIV